MPRWGSKPPDGWGFSLKGEDGWEGKGEGSWWSPHDLFGKTSSQVFCREMQFGSLGSEALGQEKLIPQQTGGRLKYFENSKRFSKVPSSGKELSLSRSFY